MYIDNLLNSKKALMALALTLASTTTIACSGETEGDGAEAVISAQLVDAMMMDHPDAGDGGDYWNRRFSEEHAARIAAEKERDALTERVRELDGAES